MENREVVETFYACDNNKGSDVMPEGDINMRTGFLRNMFRKIFRSKTFAIAVEWDAEAEVFVASSDDLDGLVAEAATVNEMVAHLQEVMPMLLEANRQSPQDIDFRIRAPWKLLVQVTA